MFLTLTAQGRPGRPASDLGFLLHKHPEKAQAFTTSHGTAHVFYPEASDERCTAALLLEVDAVALVRAGKGKGRGGAPDSSLGQYVNDRPYAASSLLAVALGAVFRSALRGVCTGRPELPGEPRPLRVEVPALPARGGAALAERLFAPLGWRVEAAPVPLDEKFPEWGDSRYVRLALEGEMTVAEALRHLYVLLPVLDGAKLVGQLGEARPLRVGGALEVDQVIRQVHGRILRRRSDTIADRLRPLGEQRLVPGLVPGREAAARAQHQRADLRVHHRRRARPGRGQGGMGAG